MRYLLCLIPPLAVLSCGKPVQFFLNLVLTLLFYIPGLIHAILVVSQFNADRRTDRIINAMTPASGAPPLPASATQGRSMKFMLLAGAFACVFVFAILAAMVAGLRNRLPAQADKQAISEQMQSETATAPMRATATDNKVPSYTIISDKFKPGGKWRIVEVRLQEKLSEDELKKISEDVNSAKPNKRKCTIFCFLPEQLVGAGAWAKAEFDPALKIEIMGNPKGAQPPKPDGEIVGQWEYAMGTFLTLSRNKDGLKMICTSSKDNAPISDQLVSAKVDGNRVTIRPTKPNDPGDYWILDEAKNLLLMDSEGTIGKAAAIVKPTLKP